MTAPNATSLVDLFRRGLSAAPQAVAFTAGDIRYTYQELDTQARALAARLAARPDGVPARVGVLAGATATAYLGFLGAMYAGASAVPLNPGFPQRRTAAMIEAAGTPVVITDERGADRVAGDVLIAPVDGGPLLDGPLLDEPRPVGPHDEAYLMFTSGSTGRPKGVPISHGNAVAFFDWAVRAYPMDAHEVIAQTFEPTFDLFLFAMFVPWAQGAANVIVPTPLYGRLPSILAAHGVTHWFSVPSAIRLLDRQGGLADGALASLTRSLFCGEALTEAAAARWSRAAPASTVDNLYGPTELTIACAAHRWSPKRDESLPDNGVVPIGRLYPGLDALVLGPQAPDEGELCVTGPQMFGGYLDPRDDEGRFVTDDGERWYRTGDRVRRAADGTLAYLGRLDHMAKVRGYRVDLLEVEHALRGLIGVEDCVVVTYEEGGETAMAAEYTGDPMPMVRLARSLADTLPAYMVPRRIRHVESLPLNGNGKVDRAVVAARAAD